MTYEVRPAEADACAAFYELLGFRRVAPPPALAESSVWLERAGTQLHLMLVDDPVVLPRGHAAVVVEDYERALDRLRHAGHEPDPRREHWGSPRAFVRDPGGNRVELMAFPPTPAE